MSEPSKHVSESLKLWRATVPLSATTDSRLVEPGPLAFDVAQRIQSIDQRALRAYRLERVRAELRRRDLAGAILANPMNIRYATGTRNMTIWTLHAPGRYAFVATDGPVVMFEFSTCQHVSRGYETIDEIRSGTSWFYLLSGDQTPHRAAHWADELSSLIRQHSGTNVRVAVDRCDPAGTLALMERGFALEDGQAVMEQARSIKCAEEVKALQLSMDVCDIAVSRLRAAVQPGLTENQIWSVLHGTNIAHDGEFVDCRLLASGPRTNPWFQECGNRVLEAGEILSFDTDMIGPLGAMADISRAYVVPGKAATSDQATLYDLAQEQVLRNMALIKPGVGFHEFAQKSWKVPQRFFANRYMVLVHGVGLCDEWPAVLYDGDQQTFGYDGHFEENMVVSVESYLGAEGGPEGIKLEQQVLVTRDGVVPFSRSPLEGALEIRG